jgi:hypothetical protein
MAEKMAENNAWRKKEAKRKAGPSGQKEKYRKEKGEPTGVKDTLEDAGRKPAQETQKKKRTRI